MIIERIYIRPSSGAPAIPCEQIEIVSGKGIVGDRYFGRQDAPGQNITLIEAEELEDFFRSQNRSVDYTLSGRNLLTRGIRLNSLVGREFMIDALRLRGVELCEPCRGFGKAHAIETHPADLVIRHFTHRAGLRADILSGGTIRCGSVIEPVRLADF